MNNIEAAVSHLKDAAIDRAKHEAKQVVGRVLAEMDAAKWNLDEAAPHPNAMEHGREEYMRMNNKNGLYSNLTTWVYPSRRAGEPNLRKRCEESEARFIDEAMENAAQQYDMFVGKLISKIGVAESAVLHGNHIWGYSFLVVMVEGEQQIWKTQMIVNVSKLGKLFNQFPTRKVKKMS